MTCIANLALALMLLQYYPQSYPRQRTVPPQANPQADKKYLTIGVEQGQTMRMYITSSTKFIRDGKPAKASEFQHDENVTVDAARDARMNLIAVRVEVVKPDKAAEPKADK